MTKKAKSKLAAKKPLRARPKVPARGKPKKSAIGKATAVVASTVRNMAKVANPSSKSGNVARTSGLPKTLTNKPSTKPFGEAGKALDGVRILDFTHVQSGPTCTQLLAYMGADVIKVERPGVGDITRGQLRDVPNADSLYFTMLNGNKR